jgi:uncharacterized protein YuzE
MTFDPVADAAMILLVDPLPEGEVVTSQICDADMTDAAVVLDLDRQGRAVAIEFLGASRILPAPVLEASERIGER